MATCTDPSRFKHFVHVSHVFVHMTKWSWLPFYGEQGIQGQDEGKGQCAAHLVRVSLTVRETVPAASCRCVLSAISACTHVMTIVGSK